MSERRRVDPELPLQERLALFAEDAREKAMLLPPGAERDALLQKVEQAANAIQLDELVKPSSAKELP